MAFIRKGKFRAVVDADGDTKYERVREVEDEVQGACERARTSLVTLPSAVVSTDQLQTIERYAISLLEIDHLPTRELMIDEWVEAFSAHVVGGVSVWPRRKSISAPIPGCRDAESPRASPSGAMLNGSSDGAAAEAGAAVPPSKSTASLVRSGAAGAPLPKSISDGGGALGGGGAAAAAGDGGSARAGAVAAGSSCVCLAPPCS